MPDTELDEAAAVVEGLARPDWLPQFSQAQVDFINGLVDQKYARAMASLERKTHKKGTRVR